MILTGTEKGLVALADDGRELFRIFEGCPVSYLRIDAGGRLLCIVDENMIFATADPSTADLDDNWQMLGELPETTANCLAHVAGKLFVGAADARLWTMPAEGGQAERLSSFDAVEMRDRWDTPWGGPPDVRSLAIISGDDSAIYADIHVGWIVRSLDLGETWTQLRGELDRDVHHVNTHQKRPYRVYAATAQGCFISEDRGDSWRQHLEPFEPRNYQRCVMPDFADPDLFLCTASLGPHPEGDTGCEAMVFRTRDGGANWEAVHKGLPEHFYHNINTHMLCASVQRPGVFAFHDDDESVYLSEDGAGSWRRIAGVPDALAILVF